MHPLSLAITGLVSSLAHLTGYTSRQEKSIQGLELTLPTRAYHMDLAVELALEAHQEVLELEGGSILGLGQNNATIIRSVVDEVDQIPIPQAIT